MASITPGTGGTFKSETAESVAVETLCYLQLQEADSVKNPNGRDAIQGSFDVNSSVFSGSYSFPVIQSLNSDGSIKVSAQTYLTGVTVTPGTGGTFKSTSLEAYCLEVLQYVQLLEAQPSKNPQSKNNVTGNLNTDTGLYQGSFTFPVTMALDATGKPEFAAQSYLLT